jgi:hypothetical protein
MLPFLVPFIGPLVDKLVGLIPDPAAREKARLEAEAQLVAQQDDMVKAFLASDQAQAAVNAEEAKSSNLFVSGWRPFLGWVFGSSFAWVFVVQPILMFVLKAVGHPVDLPTLDLSQMTPIVTGMLGLAGMRTYEKIQGAQGNH